MTPLRPLGSFPACIHEHCGQSSALISTLQAQLLHHVIMQHAAAALSRRLRQADNVPEDAPYAQTSSADLQLPAAQEQALVDKVSVPCQGNR